MEDFDQAAFEEYLAADTSDLDPSEGVYVRQMEYDPEAQLDLESF